MKQFNNKFGFTLIELLIVIGILTTLAVAVVLVINPADLVKRTRDSRRLEELASINKALNIAAVQGIASFGSPSIVYVSIPDLNAGTPTSTCANMGLPSLPTGWSYQCSNSANYRKVNGNGWIPVNFTQISSGSPLPVLPIDPVNTTSMGNYYTYVTGGSWKLATLLESRKYTEKSAKDGGPDPAKYEIGSNLNLAPFTHGLVGYWFFDEGIGTVAYDSSGNDRNGVIHGSTWVDGKFGKAIDFADTQTTDYISIPATVLHGLTDYTISFWAYGGGSGEYIISVATPGGGDNYMIFCGPTNSGWHFYVWRRSGGTAHAYTDMVQTDGLLNTNGGSTTDTSGGSLVVGQEQDALGGGFDPNQAFSGMIDDAHIYSRALSAAEISAIYNATK